MIQVSLTIYMDHYTIWFSHFYLISLLVHRLVFIYAPQPWLSIPTISIILNIPFLVSPLHSSPLQLGHSPQWQNLGKFPWTHYVTVMMPLLMIVFPLTKKSFKWPIPKMSLSTFIIFFIFYFQVHPTSHPHELPLVIWRYMIGIGHVFFSTILLGKHYDFFSP